MVSAYVAKPVTTKRLMEKSPDPDPEVVIRAIAEHGIKWMQRYNEIRPAGSVGVIVPSIEDLITEIREKCTEPEDGDQ
jgi:hypothetical protein